MLSNFKDIISRLEAQKAAIDQAIATLRQFDEGGAIEIGAPTRGIAKKAGKKRVMSAAARKAIGDAARRRWAAVRKAAGKKAA